MGCVRWVVLGGVILAMAGCGNKPDAGATADLVREEMPQLGFTARYTNCLAARVETLSGDQIQRIEDEGRTAAGAKLILNAVGSECYSHAPFLEPHPPEETISLIREFMGVGIRAGAEQEAAKEGFELPPGFASCLTRELLARSDEELVSFYNQDPAAIRQLAPMAKRCAQAAR